MRQAICAQRTPPSYIIGTMQGHSRRTAIRTAAAFTAASYSRIFGANERIRLGLIGAGGRGRFVMETFVKTDHVEVPGVCDVWPERSALAKKTAPNAQQFTDHRKMLDGIKDLDAVLIATPDHWHAQTA